MHRFAPLRNAAYRRWAAADFLSVIGTWMQSVAASWLVLDVTGSATRTGLTIAAQAMPSLLLGPIAGRIADQGRINSRKLLVATQILLSLTTLGAALGALLYSNGSIKGVALANGLLLLALVNGAIHAIEGPNLGRFALNLLGEERIPAALSLGALLSSSGRIIGTAAAGLLALVGTPMIFAFNALTFLVVGATLSTITISSQRSHEEKIATGSISRQLWLLLSASVLLGGLGRNYQVTLSALSKEEGFGAAGFAQASSLFALGAALGGIAAVLLARKRLRHYFSLAVAAGLLEITLGRSSALHQVFVLVVPIAICGVLFDVTFSSIFQSRSSAHIRGKVVAVQGAGGAIGSIIGAPTLGWLSQHFGASGALQIAGLICLTVTSVLLVVMGWSWIERVGVAPWRQPKMQSITSSMIMKSSEELSNA